MKRINRKKEVAKGKRRKKKKKVKEGRGKKTKKEDGREEMNKNRE